jgi:hypothetical protein
MMLRLDVPRADRTGVKSFLALGLVCLVAVVGAVPTAAREAGSAKPRVEATVMTRGFEKTLSVRVTDRAGKPVTRATVTSAMEMRQPHVMVYPARPLAEQARGTYRVRADFLMAGMTVTIRVSGKRVARVTAKFLASPDPQGGTRLLAA